MRFSVNQDTFGVALRNCIGIVEKRGTIPILSHVLIRAKENGTIEISASDMEIVFRTEIDALKVEEPGVVALEADRLSKLVDDAPECEIFLSEKENDWYYFESGKFTVDIPGLPAEGFPEIPDLAGAALRFSGTSLQSMIDNTAFCISGDDTRYGLSGAFFEILPEYENGGSNMARMVATDGNRLAFCSRPFEISDLEDIAGFEGSLLSRKGLKELLKLCDDFKGDTVELILTDRATAFKHAKMILFARNLEGDFPDYRQILPGSRLRRAELPRDKLMKALRRITHVNGDKAAAALFHFSGDTLTLSSTATGKGKGQETIEIGYEGAGPIKIGFNAKYAIEALAKLKGETVQLDLTEGLNPGFLHDQGVEDIGFIVMPMRVEGETA